MYESENNKSAPEQDASAGVACATRRQFLGGVSGTAAVLAVGGVGLPTLMAAPDAEAACQVGPLDPVARADKAFEVRVAAAQAQRDLPLPSHDCNGDEDRYFRKFASYSKGLKKANRFGEPDLGAYAAYRSAPRERRQRRLRGHPARL